MPKVTKLPFSNGVVAPLFLTSSYGFESTADVIAYHDGDRQNGRYARYDNPGWVSLETKLAQLDGCEAAAIFPSGMSAISMTLLALFKAGDHVVYSGKGYRNITRLCASWLPRYGITTSPIHPGGDASEMVLDQIAAALTPSTRAVIIEIPSNPHLFLADVRAMKQLLPPDCLLLVDATIATPVNFNPTLLGADLVLHSLGKYIGGHTDVMGGSVAGSHELITPIKTARNCFGPIMDSLTTFLLERSLHTLKLRVEAANEAGEAVARWLERHSQVRRVYYTGLRSHPHAGLARQMLRGHGGLMAFELDGTLEETVRFANNVDIAFMATGFGSVQTLIEPVRVFTYQKESEEARAAAGVVDSLVRLSIGTDDSSDAIIESLDRAFRCAFPMKRPHCDIGTCAESAVF